jgi:hypothetical protein
MRFGTDWLLDGPDGHTRRIMALGTSHRNISAALVVARQNFSDRKVAVVVTVDKRALSPLRPCVPRSGMYLVAHLPQAGDVTRATPVAGNASQ